MNKSIKLKNKHNLFLIHKIKYYFNLIKHQKLHYKMFQWYHYSNNTNKRQSKKLSLIHYQLYQNLQEYPNLYLSYLPLLLINKPHHQPPQCLLSKFNKNVTNCPNWNNKIPTLLKKPKIFSKSTLKVY